MILKKNKYYNQKVVTLDGKFDSKKEYQEWCQLKLLEKSGKINFLERQKEFQLIPTLKTNLGTMRRTSYYADFFYWDIEKQAWVAQDTKGFPTEIFKLKKKLLLWLYPHVIFIESGREYKEYDTREVM